VVKIKKFNCRLKDNEVTILTFWGHVTSSATQPFDSRWAIFMGGPFMTMRLSGTIMEIWWTDALMLKCYALHWTENKTFHCRQWWSSMLDAEFRGLYNSLLGLWFDALSVAWFCHDFCDFHKCMPCFFAIFVVIFYCPYLSVDPVCIQM